METKIINIDSINKINTNDTESNFVYNIEKLKNIIEIKLSSVELPNTSYAFSENKKNNKFIISAPNVNPLLPDDEYTVIIPEGNYTSASIINELNTIFQNVLFINNFGIVLNINSGNVTISGDTNFKLSFPKYSEYQSFGDLLGFSELEYNGSNSYTSNQIINVIDYHYCFLKINDLGYVYNDTHKYFAKIIISNKKYEMVFEGSDFVTKDIKFRQPIDIERLHIQLYDPYNNLIEMNGVNLSLTIEFKIINNEILKIYKEQVFYDPELMEYILNDKMLDYFSNNMKINETYNNVLHTESTKNIESKKILSSIENDIELKEIEKKDLDRLKKKKLKKLKKLKLASKFKY